jgi:release factor glutamine methyltransferase
VLVLPGVLRPPSDCGLLAATMRELGLARDANVLDVFTGSGALAVAAGLDGARAVTAVDLAPRAVLNARLNACVNRVRVRVRRGDLFEPVGGARFDLVLANPPYIPGPRRELPTRGAALAYEGGSDGRAVLNRLCAEVGDHLAPGGSALIVHSSLVSESQSLERLASEGLQPEVVARSRGRLGPIVAARAELLERCGVLARGEREEELIVIRARAPGSGRASI